jgi:hypothetical protein
MLSFRDWLNEVTMIPNQKTFDKWAYHYINQIIDRFIARIKPTSWLAYNLPYWQAHREELVQLLVPEAQREFDQEPGIDIKSLTNRLYDHVGRIFQKGPYKRRHINYAQSLGKHPDEVTARTVGGRGKGRKVITPEQPKLHWLDKLSQLGKYPDEPEEPEQPETPKIKWSPIYSTSPWQKRA